MKVDDFARKVTTRPFNVQGLKAEDFRPFVKFLQDTGYTEKNIYDRLQTFDLGVKFELMPIYLDIFLIEHSFLDRLIEIFFLNSPIPRVKVVEMTGEPMYRFLQQVGILHEDNGMTVGNVAIFPVLGHYILADQRYEAINPKIMVYPPGADSYSLARAIMQKPMGDVLDICTGSGIQGIMAARHARKVTCVDLNRRAVNFVRLNAMLNGYDNVEALEGDLMAPVKGRKFDLITINPPFVPAPEQQLYFRDGSTSGTAIMEKAIEKLPEHLNEDGLCQIYTLIPVTERSIHDRIRDWIGEKPAHVLTAINMQISLEVFLMDHINPKREGSNFYDKQVRWMKTLMQEGIKSISFGSILIKWAKNAKPQSRELHVKLPTRSFWKELDTIMELLDHVGDHDYVEGLLKGSFRISPEVDYYATGKKLDGSGKYGVVFRESSLQSFLDLEREHVVILDAIMAGASGGEMIREEFLKSSGLSGDGGRQAFNGFFFDLLEKLVVEKAG
jgi:HemK-related putative methylase